MSWSWIRKLIGIWQVIRISMLNLLSPLHLRSVHVNSGPWQAITGNHWLEIFLVWWFKSLISWCSSNFSRIICAISEELLRSIDKSQWSHTTHSARSSSISNMTSHTRELNQQNSPLSRILCLTNYPPPVRWKSISSNVNNPVLDPVCVHWSQAEPGLFPTANRSGKLPSCSTVTY